MRQHSCDVKCAPSDKSANLPEQDLTENTVRASPLPTILTDEIRHKPAFTHPVQPSSIVLVSSIRNRTGTREHGGVVR